MTRPMFFATIAAFFGACAFSQTAITAVSSGGPIQTTNQLGGHLRIRLEEDRIPQLGLFQPAWSSEGEGASGEPRTELAQFLSSALSDGNNWSLGELKRLAAQNGINFGEKNPGRVIHFALLGMAQSDAVEMVEKGVWRRKQHE